MALAAKTVTEWKHHLREEADAAFLYGELASVEPEASRREIYAGLALVEGRHVELWRETFRRHGVQVAVPNPSLRARILARVARLWGPSLLTSLLLREEGEEVQGYMRLHRESAPGPARETALVLARESAEHAQTLSVLSGSSRGEPWHHTDSSRLLRNVIYGFNDGLTANFGLVAGIIGAEVPAGVVLVSGVAGAIADALSMGASGFLAAKSEREVHEHEIAKEREELYLMPEIEREELSLIYQAQGIPRERAERMSTEVLADPERAIAEKVRVELGIGVQSGTPLREGWVTGVATAVGAIIPVAPFLLFQGSWAIGVSFGISMLAHFVVGALRTLFTGRGTLRSGFDMFVVGLGVATVGFVVGGLVSNWLEGAGWGG